MIRVLSSVLFWLMSGVAAYAQNAAEQPPTTFTEPASMTAMIVFFVLFFGSIAGFAFWVWYRSKQQKD